MSQVTIQKRFVDCQSFARLVTNVRQNELSHEMLIENNLVYRCQDGALFVHRSRDITARNNIFALTQNAAIDRGGIGGFELTCERNLIYCLKGKAVGEYGRAHLGRNVCAFNKNLYWNASGKPAFALCGVFGK